VWAAGLVDRVQIYETPATLGPRAVPWLPDTVVNVDRLVDRRTVSLGDDLMTEGYVHRAD
jgi:hypothetical protein